MTAGGAAVRVLSLVQVADYPAGAAFGPRRLNEDEFVWVLRGSAVWTVSGGDERIPLGGPVASRLRPGTLALARANTVDSYQWDPDSLSTHAYVHFQIESPGAFGAPSTWPLTRDMSRLPVLSALSDYLLQLAGQEGDRARERSDQLIALLLDLYVRGPLEEQHQLPPLIERVREHVRRRWERDGPQIVPVADLAAAASTSTGHLFRIFREEYGCGPARALELIRLARAATALQRSNASLAQIAELNGFASAYHFSRRFAATYGSPPGRFRSHAENEDPLGPVRRQGLLPLSMSLTTHTAAGGQK